MRLEGSCHCGAVRFSVHSRHPAPYQRCYCSICRKCGGGGGFLINLAADAATLRVQGTAHVRVYRAVSRDPADPKHQREAATRSKHERHFCGDCGAHLWAAHPDWPELVHPVAGAIDTELPRPAATVHIMTASAAHWAPLEVHPADERYAEYPAQSIAQWHDAHGLTEQPSEG